MDDRLDPLDREMMRSDRRYKRRLRPIKLSCRSVGCLMAVIVLVVGCVASRFILETISGQIEAWRSPTPTPRPPVRVIVPPPTPPIPIITPLPGNEGAVISPTPCAPG